MTKFICGDCNSVLEFDEKPRGSKIIEIILWSTLVIPGFFYSLWRKGKKGKICYYCGGDFILPDSYESRELLKPITKKN